MNHVMYCHLVYGAITGGATTTLTNTLNLLVQLKKQVLIAKDIRNEVLDNKKTKKYC